ncbi:MAG: menaquinone biosynthesis decarboxylase [Spirochaetes bacterium]|nr:menaquinone biosynthesis decarboxylase [Spirochaetota bacterium]
MKNTKDFIELLKKNGEIVIIDAPASAHLEIPALAEKMMKKPAGGKAMLFTNVEGTRMPVAVNLFGSKRRLALAFGVDDLKEIPDRIRKLIGLTKNTGGLTNILSLLGEAKGLMHVPPKKVDGGYCQEIIKRDDAASLDDVPILHCWEGDGGPFITLPMVITKSPRDGIYNMGMYRMQKFDAKTTGMHWHRHKVGARHYREHKEMGIKRMPVCVAIGGSPALIYSSTAPLPPQIDEYAFTGFLQDENVRITKAVTNDLMVPADAEIILEGYVDTEEPYRREGPFGDHTGYYSLADDYPVFHLTAITTCKNPVYPATVVGVPPMEDYYFGHMTERIFLPILQIMLPEIVEYAMPSWGVFHNFVFVSIKKEFPSHAKKVIYGLWGLGMMMLTKVIVVVDADVNVHDDHEALWVTLNNIDPKRDLVFGEGPLDELDHAAPIAAVGGKLGIDGTRKWPNEANVREYPDKLARSESFMNDLRKKWNHLGLF